MANEFVIKNGYFSQGNSNVTGSLQVTGSVGVTGSVSITENLTASKALISSSGNEQLIVMGSGSSSWITGIYGSQGNLLTVTDTFSGSIFTVTDISGYPILDITSDYYTSSINTIGFLNHTGSAGVTGSLIVSGGFEVYDTINNSKNINSNLRSLYDSDSSGSIDWNNRILKGATATNSIDWDQRRLLDNDATPSLLYSSRELYAGDGSTIQMDWSNTNYINFPNVNINTIVSVLGLDDNGNLYATASSAIGGGGSGTPGGSNRQVQFNANGTSFSGSSNFTFDSSSNTVVLTGSLTVSGSGTFTNIGPARLTGSVNITGSTTLTGSLNISGGITGSLFGTASWATNALTASYFSGFNSTSSFIGNGALTTWNVNHGFNTFNLHITVYSASGTYENVYPDIRRINANTASIVFANPPLTGQYIVYISQ